MFIVSVGSEDIIRDVINFQSHLHFQYIKMNKSKPPRNQSKMVSKSFWTLTILKSKRRYI